ncbi:MAG: VanZ family protein [Candidatus Latescibacterota bacterium]|nr:MAG: VanZ family protein [Candidatus Latescibacterota bacterium]
MEDRRVIEAAAAGFNRRRASRALLVTYCLFVTYTTLLPFRFSLDRATLAANLDRISWHPLHNVYGLPAPAFDLVGNIIFFMPLGVLAYLAQRRRTGSDRARIARATAWGLALSLAVETLQLLTPGRSPATSDLLTNTLGALLGAVVTAAAWRWKRSGRFRRLAHRVRTRPGGTAAAGLVMVVMLQGLLPFDPSLRSAARALEALRAAPWIGAGADNLHAAPVYALLAGVLLFPALKRSRRRRLTRFALVLAAVLVGSTLLEAAQLVLHSRTTALLDVVAALLGSSVGILVAGFVWRRPRHAWAWVTGGYTLGLVSVTLLDVRPWITVSRWLGLTSSARVEPSLSIVTGSLLHLLLYAPLGYLVARRHHLQTDPSSWKLGAWVATACASVALLLETTRLLVLGGADGWRLVSASLGGLVGAYACAWSEAAAAEEAQRSMLASTPRAATASAEASLIATTSS